jgi:tetratricopeptide (TPR) repeat protein
VGKTDSSLAMYAIAISQNPDAYIPYLNRGRIYFRLKNYDAALKDFSKAIALNSESGELYYKRAQVLAAKGNMAGAKEDVQKAKALHFTAMDPAFEQSLR